MFRKLMKRRAARREAARIAAIDLDIALTTATERRAADVHTAIQRGTTGPTGTVLLMPWVVERATREVVAVLPSHDAVIAALRADFRADPDLALKYAGVFMAVPEQAGPTGEHGDVAALRIARTQAGH